MFLKTDFGWIALQFTEGVLSALEFVKEPLAGFAPIDSFKLITELKDYQLGKLQTFTIPLALKGTPFQKKVWQELLQIPYGHTRSYKEIAQQIGRPTAYRAVANAIGSNPISLIIPCHRVIAHDGALGGFRWGLELKKQLFQHERGE